MGLIHQTTLKPTKLELLTDWLPTCPWYRGGTGQPSLTRVDGFRLDDPAGEVGIEFMVAADDPVLVRQLVALIQGQAEPQAQSQSDTQDPTVLSFAAASHELVA
jgi:hypothetical protein